MFEIGDRPHCAAPSHHAKNVAAMVYRQDLAGLFSKTNALLPPPDSTPAGVVRHPLQITAL